MNFIIESSSSYW